MAKQKIDHELTWQNSDRGMRGPPLNPRDTLLRQFRTLIVIANRFRFLAFQPISMLQTTLLMMTPVAFSTSDRLSIWCMFQGR